MNNAPENTPTPREMARLVRMENEFLANGRRDELREAMQAVVQAASDETVLSWAPDLEAALQEARERSKQAWYSPDKMTRPQLLRWAAKNAVHVSGHAGEGLGRLPAELRQMAVNTLDARCHLNPILKAEILGAAEHDPDFALSLARLLAPLIAGMLPDPSDD